MRESRKKILGICGSLRENSSTGQLMKQAETLLSESVDFTIYNEIANLPHFNDAAEMPPVVTAFCHAVTAADAVLIITPEYAFGVPGSLKNALDWTVSTIAFNNKPLALVTAATGGDKAHAAFQLIFTALSCELPPDRQLLLPSIRSKLDKMGNWKDMESKKAFAAVIHNLADRVGQ